MAGRAGGVVGQRVRLRGWPRDRRVPNQRARPDSTLHPFPFITTSVFPPALSPLSSFSIPKHVLAAGSFFTSRWRRLRALVASVATGALSAHPGSAKLVIILAVCQAGFCTRSCSTSTSSIALARANENGVLLLLLSFSHHVSLRTSTRRSFINMPTGRAPVKSGLIRPARC